MRPQAADEPPVLGHDHRDGCAGRNGLPGRHRQRRDAAADRRRDELQPPRFLLDRALLRDTIALALDDLTRMRSREGEALKADLTVHLKLLESLRQRILARAPGVVEDYRQRLTQRIAELGATEIDSSRVVQEVAIFADRAAIDEELSRLDSHIHQAYLLMDGEAECGSKLNFLVQEMNREVNTIGSKALDAEIARLVVEAKSEIEKLREQIQNVE